MRLVRSLDTYTDDTQGLALSIGNFDGLHIGHRAIIKELTTRAKAMNLTSAVMCFEPQPLEFFGKNKIPARLSRFRDKLIGLRELGINRLFCLRFNEMLSDLSPEDFIFNVLFKKLNVRLLIVGDDFCFGKGGSGNYDLLKQYANKLGYEVISMPSYKYNNERVSSTSIRKLLSYGLLDRVAPMLGEYFYIRGKVCHGKKIGSTLNFPTANINLNRRVVPIFGSYAVKILMPDDSTKYGIANVGLRPTVNGNYPLLEVFIFDFTGNLYTKEIKVSFIKKLRDEKKFPSLEALKKQIAQDEMETRRFFGILQG
ncbi:MAG: bifunctional riboflavin kinase/FAD synthetase [Ruminobacter sp.]|jgi:riboflavin kinase/FMN adenylyltransferase|nr:bifunctional riboflavin kinase/FAD synthetase [Ruminobacter sp.]